MNNRRLPALLPPARLPILALALLAVSGAEPAQAHLYDSGPDFNTLDAAGNDDPEGIWSNGTTMWVADAGDGKEDQRRTGEPYVC